MLASSKPIHCFSPLGRKLDVGWPRIEDFQLRGHSCVNNVQRCLCHFYTWMRHSKQTATLLLTKHHANFDTLTSAKGYARVCTNCACAIVVLGILLAQARPTMPCIHLVIYIYRENLNTTHQCGARSGSPQLLSLSYDRHPRAALGRTKYVGLRIRVHGFRDRKRITRAPRLVA